MAQVQQSKPRAHVTTFRISGITKKESRNSCVEYFKTRGNETEGKKKKKAYMVNERLEGNKFSPPYTRTAIV